MERALWFAYTRTTARRRRQRRHGVEWPHTPFNQQGDVKGDALPDAERHGGREEVGVRERALAQYD